MNIRHLTIFITVCQQGSMTAAQKLYISQPSVSSAIREFENEYGVQFFDRSSKRLTLTEYGQEVYVYGTRILSLIDDISTSISKKNINTTLRLGTGTAFGAQYLPHIVKKFKKYNPQCIFDVTIDSSEVLEPLLANGELDLCIMEGTSHIPDFHHQEIYNSPIVTVCHKDHPLADKKNVTAKQLIQEPLLLREKLCPTREMVNAYFSNQNLSVTSFTKAKKASGLLNAVKENLGIAMLPLDHYQYFYSPELTLVDVPDFNYKRYIDFIYRKK